MKKNNFLNKHKYFVCLLILLSVADILMFIIALLRKDKQGAFASLPILAIVLSLLVATPVYSEFRYIYAAFCALPMIITIVLRPLDN